jgi:hypothetical protein
VARAQRLAGLPEAHFWELTPAEVDAILMEALEEIRVADWKAAYHAARIEAALYNCHRDSKKHPEPFRAEDFLPQLFPEPEIEPPPPDVVADKARGIMKLVSKINHQ